MDNNYTLSVVFCTINETTSLIDAYSKISKHHLADEYLFVVAKKASTECLKVVQELCKNEKCRYITQSGYGLGNAITDGFFAVNGSHIIFWPADDDMDASAFPQMVELSKNYPQKIVSVSRWLAENGFDGYPKFRKAINYFSQKAFAVIYKSDLTDFTNPTQIAPTKLYRSIKWSGNDFELIPEMIFKPLRLGCEFIEVPCKNIPRTDGKTNGSFFKFAKYYKMIFKIRKMDKNDIYAGVEE